MLSHNNCVSETFWVLTVGIAASALIAAFAIMTFAKSSEKNRRLEYMKKLESFDAEIIRFRKEFEHSAHLFDDCVVLARRHLDLLDKISFFKHKSLVDQDFVQYFHSDFDAGRMFLNWLNIMNSSVASKHPYKHFRQVKDTLDYANHNVVLPSGFYYYVAKHDRDPSYDPYSDLHDSSSYDFTTSDISLIKP